MFHLLNHTPERRRVEALPEPKRNVRLLLVLVLHGSRQLVEDGVLSRLVSLMVKIVHVCFETALSIFFTASKLQFLLVLTHGYRLVMRWNPFIHL